MSPKKLCVMLPLVALAAVTGCGKKSETGTSSGSTTSASSTPAGAVIKLGNTAPFSGPASAYGILGKVDAAYIKMLNDKGGINGRTIDLVQLDDAYNPAKTVETTRKLVESEGVLAMFGSVGTAPQGSVHTYLNEKKVPQLFIATGGDRWADPVGHPWTIGWQPSYRAESKIYARYIAKEKPNAKVCMLYQNDDFGKDYQNGLKDGFADQYDKLMVKQVSYEVTDPTIDSQIVTLQGAGCDTLVVACTPKFAAQTIRKVADIGWKPLMIVGNVSISINAVLKPAGLDKSTGIVTGAFLKDPSDPKLADDPGLKDYRAFMKQYAPELDLNDSNAVSAYSQSFGLQKVLEQCGADVSRENIMKQALSLSHVKVPVLIDGIEVNTSPTDFRPVSQMQLARFNGTSFERFGSILSSD